MICIQSFIKIGSDILKLKTGYTETHTREGGFIILLLFFLNKGISQETGRYAMSKTTIIVLTSSYFCLIY
jgi:hypothetical protein